MVAYKKGILVADALDAARGALIDLGRRGITYGTFMADISGIFLRTGRKYFPNILQFFTKVEGVKQYRKFMKE